MSSPKAEPAAAEADGGKKSKNKIIIIIAAAVVVALLAGGGAFMMLGKKKHGTAAGGGAETTASADKSKADADDSGDEEKVKKKHKKKSEDADESASDSEDSADEGGDEEEGSKAKKPAQYLTFTPSFVINLQDEEAMRYLQLDIDVMTRDEKAAELIKSNMPRMRYELMMLFSTLHSADVISRQGKEKLQKSALATVRKVMKQETGKSCIEGLYFTNFVMQ